MLCLSPILSGYGLTSPLHLSSLANGEWGAVLFLHPYKNQFLYNTLPTTFPQPISKNVYIHIIRQLL
jgi:hypothetical protein